MVHDFDEKVARALYETRVKCMRRGYREEKIVLILELLRGYFIGGGADSIRFTQVGESAKPPRWVQHAIEEARWRFIAACIAYKWEQKDIHVHGRKAKWYEEMLPRVMEDLSKAREARKARGGSELVVSSDVTDEDIEHAAPTDADDGDTEDGEAAPAPAEDAPARVFQM